MTAVVTAPPPPAVLPDGLTRKQLKYIKKYDTTENRDAGLITARIHESWYTPTPPQLRSGYHVIVGATLLTILIGVIAAAVVGTPDASALYYTTTQTNHGIKSAWDTVWTPLRHAYRDDMIGLIGGLAAVFVARDLYKPLTPLTKRDQREIDFHIGKWHPLGNVKDDKDLSVWQVLPLPVFVVLFGMFGFFVGNGVVMGIHWLYDNWGWYHSHVKQLAANWFSFLQGHIGEHNAAVVTRLHNSLVSSLPAKFVGLMTAFFFGRKPAKPIMDDLKRWLVKRRLIKNYRAGHRAKRAPVYYLRNFRKIYYTEQPNITASDTISWKSTLGLWTLGVFMLTAAIRGWYIVLFIVNK